MAGASARTGGCLKMPASLGMPSMQLVVVEGEGMLRWQGQLGLGQSMPCSSQG